MCCSSGSKGDGGAAKNMFVDHGDVEVIKAWCSRAPSELGAALQAGESTAVRYPNALLRSVLNIRDERVIQFALTLLVDFLQVDTEKRARYFLAEDGEQTLQCLLQYVGASGAGARVSSTEQNSYILEKAARAASLLLSVDAATLTQPSSVTTLTAWVQNNLRLFGNEGRQARVTEVRGRPLFPAQCHFDAPSPLRTPESLTSNPPPHTLCDFFGRWPWSP
jgi:hypothetical protein